jgi:hypothetical protein
MIAPVGGAAQASSRFCARRSRPWFRRSAGLRGRCFSDEALAWIRPAAAQADDRLRPGWRCPRGSAIPARHLRRVNLIERQRDHSESDAVSSARKGRRQVQARRSRVRRKTLRCCKKSQMRRPGLWHLSQSGGCCWQDRRDSPCGRGRHLQQVRVVGDGARRQRARWHQCGRLYPGWRNGLQRPPRLNACRRSKNHLHDPECDLSRRSVHQLGRQLRRFRQQRCNRQRVSLESHCWASRDQPDAGSGGYRVWARDSCIAGQLAGNVASWHVLDRGERVLRRRRLPFQRLGNPGSVT